MKYLNINGSAYAGTEFITAADVAPQVAAYDDSDLDAVRVRLSAVSYNDYVNMLKNGELI